MAFLKYSLVRAALFVVPFAVFLLLGIGGVLSAVYACIIAFAVSFLFLRGQRNAAVSDVSDVFGGRKKVRTSVEEEDAEAEDAIDEAQRVEEEYPEIPDPEAANEKKQTNNGA